MLDDNERLAKLQKKTENNKEKEKVMWKKLDELNKNSRALKHKKEQTRKKCLPRLLINYYFINVVSFFFS